MGVCLEPTPSMGPYSVEIRSQSFYLNRLDAQPDAVTQPDRYELTVPIGDTAMIIAALDQVVRHPNWSQQPKPSGDTPSDTAWTHAAHPNTRPAEASTDPAAHTSRGPAPTTTTSPTT
jgi:hypothetical protein